MGNLNPNRLTKDTQAVLDDAVDIMTAYGKALMTPEAVLLALIRSKDTAAARVLQYFAEKRGADLDRLERQVKLAVQSRRDISGELKYLARGKQSRRTQPVDGDRAGRGAECGAGARTR